VRAFDLVSYARSEQPPALFAGGTNNPQWAAESLIDTVRRYNGPHWLTLAPGKEHELDAPARAAIGRWLAHILKGAPPPATAAVTVEGGKWTARIDSRPPPRTVSFFYGAGTGEWSEREWKEASAAREDDRRWTVAAPEDAVGAPLLLRVSDAEGAAFTSEVAPTNAPKGATPAPKSPTGAVPGV
jgi:hypothetical protein